MAVGKRKTVSSGVLIPPFHSLSSHTRSPSFLRRIAAAREHYCWDTRSPVRWLVGYWIRGSISRADAVGGLACDPEIVGVGCEAAPVGLLFWFSALWLVALYRQKEALPTETLDFRTGADTYSFPTPSPQLPPGKSATFAASPSPMSTSSNQPSPQIGVALGSPGNLGSKPNYARAFTADQPQTRTSRPPLQQMAQSWQPPSTEPPERPQLRKSKSAWKTFGGLFKSKQARDPLASKSRPPPTPPKDAGGRIGVLDSPSPAFTSSPEQVRGHNRTSSRGMQRFEARTEADRAALTKATAPEPPTTQPQPHHTTTPQNPSPAIPTAIPRTPRLDIDLPPTEFERYSIMFENLLPPKPSLLERRSSRSKTPVKPLDLPKRSLTSPHHVSPDKPAPPAVFHRARPLARSRTAPPAALSPVATRFAREEREEDENGNGSPASPLYSEPSLPPTPTSSTTTTTTTTTLGPIAVSAVPELPPSEPKWEMLTPQAPPRREFPRVKSPEDWERQIVQVSVARQVSVSKARMRVREAQGVKQPLRPRVVELGKCSSRKSTVVVLEGGE